MSPNTFILIAFEMSFKGPTLYAYLFCCPSIIITQVKPVTMKLKTLPW